MKLIDIEDEALLKTVSLGKMSMKQLWKRIRSEREIKAIPIEWIEEQRKHVLNTIGAAILSQIIEDWRKENE